MTGRADIIIRAVEAAIRLVVGALTDRDAEDVVARIQALGPARKADVRRIEAEARRALEARRNMDGDA